MLEDVSRRVRALADDELARAVEHFFRRRDWSRGTHEVAMRVGRIHLELPDRIAKLLRYVHPAVELEAEEAHGRLNVPPVDEGARNEDVVVLFDVEKAAGRLQTR